MCGIAGTIAKDGTRSIQTGRIIYNLLSGLQHRGLESCGITLDCGNYLKTRKRPGLVVESLPLTWIDRRPSLATIGQVRYSTQGQGVSKNDIALQTYGLDDDEEFDTKNAQPFYTETAAFGVISVVQNGNLTNVDEIRTFLASKNYRWLSETDSELIPLLIRYYIDNSDQMTVYHLSQICESVTDQRALEKVVANPILSVVNAIRNAMRHCKGSYSCILLIDGKLFAFRDPFENRPLKVAETEGHWIVASESCCWHKYRAEFVADVPGDSIMHISGPEYTVYAPPTRTRRQKCSFEKPYLMNPNSALTSEGNRAAGHCTVAAYRDEGGRMLYREHPLGPGIVIPVMESGDYYAQGYQAEHSIHNPGLSFYFNCYPKDPSAGRTFMLTEQKDREIQSAIKFFNLTDAIIWRLRHIVGQIKVAENNPVVWIILLDDSLVRSTTMKRYVKRVRDNIVERAPDLAPMFRVAVILGVPPITHPCFLGVDTPTRIELAAAKWGLDQIRSQINADYLGYPSLHAFQKLQGERYEDYCFACMNGNYIIPISKKQQEAALIQL